MLFGCGSRAPHGGIFVIGIMDHAPMFLPAVLAGADQHAGHCFVKSPEKKKRRLKNSSTWYILNA